MNNQKYKDLSEQYKKLKQKREVFVNELAENKGNLAAYNDEKEKYIKKAEELGTDPKNLKKEIEKLEKEISTQLDANKKICDELENNTIG